MIFASKTWGALVLVVAMVAAALLVAGNVGAAPASVKYSLAGTYAYSQPCDVTPCGTNAYSYAGSGSCLQGCTGFPTTADVTINVSGAVSKPFPPSPCISKSVSGTFSITWSDATVSTGTLSGRSHDGKAYSLSGTISGGADAGGSITALVGFPPSPCLLGSFTGGFALFPPGPPT